MFPDRKGRPNLPTTVVRQGLDPALGRARLRRVTFHRLRHGFGSIAVSSGVPLKVVQAWMGHSSINITLDVYGHLLPGDDERGLELFEARLDQSGNFLGTSA